MIPTLYDRFSPLNADGGILYCSTRPIIACVSGNPQSTSTCVPDFVFHNEARELEAPWSKEVISQHAMTGNVVRTMQIERKEAIVASYFMAPVKIKFRT